MAKEKAETPVLVTTEHRGVFFGYMNGNGPDGQKITIKRARCCVYWSADVRGFMGLAATGPNKNCRIGPAVPSLFLEKVTAVIECTPESAKAWEAGPWNG